MLLGLGEEACRLATLDRRACQAREERVGATRARAQLWVSLGRDVVRVHLTRQLDVLDEFAVWAQAREREACVCDLAAERVVDLVAVAVTLACNLSTCLLYTSRCV